MKLPHILKALMISNSVLCSLIEFAFPTVSQTGRYFWLPRILQPTKPLTNFSGHCCQVRRFLTFGRDALEPELWVVIVKTVVMPSATLAGAASMFIQKETQDKMTIKRLGMYIWIK